jgi:hypothetical protein
MLYASAENRDWGVGRIEPRSSSSSSMHSSPGRAISYPRRAIFRGCVIQGRKTAKWSKNRIENRSHHHHAQLTVEVSGAMI